MPRATEALDIRGVSTYNNMRALDGSKKLFCIGCGGPRDVSFAETNACGCCGSFGTQKVQPLFDEHGERLSDEAVELIRASERQARAALKAVEPVEQPVKVQAASKAKAAPKPAAPQTKPSARERKQAVTSTLASLF
jgi:hypothetical protein